MAKFRYIHRRATMIDPNGGAAWALGEVRLVSDIRQIQRLQLHPDCFEEVKVPALLQGVEPAHPFDDDIGRLGMTVVDTSPQSTVQAPPLLEPLAGAAAQASPVVEAVVEAVVETVQEPVEKEPELEEEEMLGKLPPLESLSKADIQRIARREFGHELDGTMKVADMRLQLAKLVNGGLVKA